MEEIKMSIYNPVSLEKYLDPEAVRADGYRAGHHLLDADPHAQVSSSAVEMARAQLRRGQNRKRTELKKELEQVRGENEDLDSQAARIERRQAENQPVPGEYSRSNALMYLLTGFLLVIADIMMNVSTIGYAMGMQVDWLMIEWSDVLSWEGLVIAAGYTALVIILKIPFDKFLIEPMERGSEKARRWTKWFAFGLVPVTVLFYGIIGFTRWVLQPMMLSLDYDMVWEQLFLPAGDYTGLGQVLLIGSMILFALVGGFAFAYGHVHARGINKQRKQKERAEKLEMELRELTTRQTANRARIMELQDQVDGIDEDTALHLEELQHRAGLLNTVFYSGMSYGRADRETEDRKAEEERLEKDRQKRKLGYTPGKPEHEEMPRAGGSPSERMRQKLKLKVTEEY
jgi:hypothetical protein